MFLALSWFKWICCRVWWSGSLFPQQIAPLLGSTFTRVIIAVLQTNRCSEKCRFPHFTYRVLTFLRNGRLSALTVKVIVSREPWSHRGGLPFWECGGNPAGIFREFAINPVASLEFSLQEPSRQCTAAGDYRVMRMEPSTSHTHTHAHTV